MLKKIQIQKYYKNQINNILKDDKFYYLDKIKK